MTRKKFGVKVKKAAAAVLLPLLTLSLFSCAYLFPFPADTETGAGTHGYQSTDLNEDNAEFSPRIPKISLPYYNEISRYAWSVLTPYQKELYYKVLEAALAYKPSVEIPEEDAAYIYECVFFDTPELFYLDERPGYEDGQLIFNYAFSRFDAQDISSILNLAFNELCVHINDGMTDYEKLKYLYEYIINRTKYAFEADEDYENNVYNESVYRASCAAGPMIDKKAICIGYARATQYICLRLGIRAFTVKGEGEGGNHYYDLVLLDDGYYYVDTTWGDPVGKDRNKDYLTYYYFCITTEELLRSHKILTNVPLPVCTAEKYNYYVYNGLTAKDAGEIAEKALAAYRNGEEEIKLKVEYNKLDSIYNAASVAVQKVFSENKEYGVSFSVSKSKNPSLVTVIFK